MQRLKLTLQNIAGLFYPNLCFACQKNKVAKGQSICMECEYKISPTNYHKMADNPVMQRFWGRIPLEQAATCFEFHKGGLLQKLIHQLKYRNQPNIGVELGKIYGAMLRHSPSYRSIDWIIPVPLHPQKQHKRGYNQATVFAEGLAATMGVNWSEDFLIRTNQTTSQTKKSRMERFANVQNAFAIQNAEQLQDKHILLVDDIITTGATLEACAIQLLKIKGLKVSLAAIALSENN